METKFIKANSKLIPRYTCGIYAIKNNLNGRMYIGSSTNIRARYEAHYRSLHSNTIIAQYDSIREASRATGVSRQSISDCLRKNARHKHAGGFTWRRVKIKEGQYDK